MLKGRKEIASDKIGVWGGSNGGWVAPLAASLSSDVAFVITVAGAAVPPTELAKWRSVNYVRNAGYSDEVVERDITVVILSGADHNMNRPSGPRPVLNTRRR